MARKIGIIPKAPVGRLILNAGAKRVSATAVDVFTELLQQRAEEIGNLAVEIARHSGRKTVQEEDIRIAAKQLKFKKN